MGEQFSEGQKKKWRSNFVQQLCCQKQKHPLPPPSFNYNKRIFELLISCRLFHFLGGGGEHSNGSSSRSGALLDRRHGALDPPLSTTGAAHRNRTTESKTTRRPVRTSTQRFERTLQRDSGKTKTKIQKMRHEKKQKRKRTKTKQKRKRTKTKTKNKKYLNQKK